ncbi:FAF2 [Cordylochernes scorpioides]|uniref:FAF2 n=1 Tax=Cordylochernes scorpioides TaxID=51811 RepID=A0ABY6K1H3_9ARAC|nr:FAF2 [Cordylochernes scorpioides]
MRMSQALRENTYPFLAVIVLRDNRMTLVARIEGPQEPRDLLNKIQSVISENEGALISARLERQERSLNQTLRQQQDEAYQASLRADQEKARKRRELREQEEAILRREQEERMNEERKKEELQKKKESLSRLLTPEPHSSETNVIRIVIKLPNGTRLERKFKPSDSIKHLYYFILCHEESPDNFQVVNNFPRQVLPVEPTPERPDPPTFQEMGFSRNQMLFVQDLEA